MQNLEEYEEPYKLRNSEAELAISNIVNFSL